MNHIPLMVPDIQDTDIEKVVAVLKSGMLVQNTEVIELERNFSDYTNTPYSLAVSSGTASLHLALMALGVGAGDEVIVPAFSYVATANVVEIVKAKPVFVDIDLRTFNMDSTLIQPVIRPNTKAIIPVHEFGLACDITNITKLACQHDVRVIEDAACALGAKENGKHVGTFGDIGSFSLHPRKTVTSGEGGIVTTAKSKISQSIKALRNHGIEYIDDKMTFTTAGLNYRMTDFQAALVNSQFKRLETTIKTKQTLVNVYYNELKESHLNLPTIPLGKNHTWQTFHILLDADIDRDLLIQKLREKGIGTNYGAQCIPFEDYYQKKYQLNCAELFPNALRAYKSGLALPIYSSLSESDIKFISKTMNRIL